MKLSHFSEMSISTSLTLERLLRNLFIFNHMKSFSIESIKLFFLVVVACSLVSCSGGWQPPPQMPVPVQTLKLKEQVVYDTSDFLAVLKSRKSVILSSEFTGVVSKILVKSGDLARKGQLLVQLRADSEFANLNSSKADSSSRVQSLNIAKQNLNSYKAQLKEAKDKLALAKKQFNRYQKLFEKQLVSKTQLEQYEDSLIQAQSEYDSISAEESMRFYEIERAKSQLNQSYSAINQQKAIIDKLKLTAPFSGTVGDIPVKEGDLVDSQTELITVANIQNLEVYVNIPAEKVSKLKIGSKIELLDYQGKVVGNADVSFISPTVDQDSQTILIKADYVNDKKLFRDEQEIRVRITWGEASGILLPVGAVNRFGRNTFVFVVNKVQKKKKSKNVVKQVEVQLGDIKDGFYQVISGLEVGQLVVTEGIEKLFDGSEVVFQNEQKLTKDKKLNGKKTNKKT
ncbi:MAG: efflux RND transporter periplasmic adaptor subunit [Candidatus Caenarcaniphilales bacterium]|nr:efflux RND transporter periplasmic adaptor subunit [Candidatus Caenarcaniphilales bacterium]